MNVLVVGEVVVGEVVVDVVLVFAKVHCPILQWPHLIEGQFRVIIDHF